MGQVYGLHLMRGGAEVTYFVRERYVDELRAGTTLHALPRGGARTLRPTHVRSDVDGVAEGFDQVWLCVPTNALTSGALDPVLAAVAKEEQPGLIILGKQAIDDDSNQTGQMLAALLGWSQATFASKLEVDGSDFKVMREVDGGLQTVKVKGPAIVTTDLRLNEPRYASLPNIMKAKKKPIDEKAADSFGIDLSPRLEVLKTTEPPGRKAGVKVKDVAELVSKLKEAGAL